MSDKKEKCIIVGKSGSGKDHLMRGLIKKGLKYSPKFTNRPMRALEKQGVDYDFINDEQFFKMKESGQIKVYQIIPVINNQIWYYGYTTENFENNQVFIMTPHELSQLSKEDLKGTFIVYLDIDMDTRRNRISNRNDKSDSIERRLQGDELDFRGFNHYDLKITDPEFESEWVYDLMD
jgi:guanylate kinase